ncbi:outer membrane beta-barrel protein [Candidatus Cardinium hertigii]|uniref:outer membrane beta-barrel protein n=1 Tax=Candidatus Cardinium hertigii TaxID=247481 RepID=UPI003D7CDA54
MKNIKKTLIAGLFACGAFNAQAEVNPFSWGAKIGPSLSYASTSNDTKINGNKAGGKFFDTVFFHGGLYAEYAFTDYIGIGVEAGYMKLAGTLTTEEKQANNNNNNNNNNTDQGNTTNPKSSSSIAMASHGIAIPLHLHCYPLGREEESGILKINLGVTPYFPVKTSCTQDGTDLDLDDDKKKELPSYRFAVHGGVGYEFPFGLAIDAKYAIAFEKGFNLEEGKDQSIFKNVTKLERLSTHHLTLGVGFNFMSLFTQ